MNYAVILAGGSGSRFWPLSRRDIPKQFLKIVEKESLLKATVRRIRQIIPDNHIFIITHRLYLDQIKNQLNSFNIAKENILLEPYPRNTLPAIALCAQMIKLKDPEANLLISPSDHYIKNNSRFKQAIDKALDVSKEGLLCLIGIKPAKPSLGYGYIQAKQLKDKDIFSVTAFYEKPERAKAKYLFKKKNIYWNSGIFCFTAKSILSQIKLYLPKVYGKISCIKNKSDIVQAWQKIPSVSIDYGILEKSNNLVMVKGKFAWSDLGTWDSLSDVLPKDKRKNVILSDCDYVSLDSSNTLVCSYNRKRLIAAIGLKDLIVVDTPDALLVCRKERTQEVKKLVQLLKKKRKAYV